MASRSLRDETIEKLLFDYAESEDGFDGDDDSVADPDFFPDLDVPNEIGDFERVDGVDIDTIIENIEGSSSTTQLPASSDTLPQPGPSSRPGSSVRSQNKQKLNLRWKRKNLQLNEQQIRFTGNDDLPAEFLELDTPVQFFFNIFPSELFTEIAKQTNLYIVQKDPNMLFRVTDTDIQQFIGLVFIMSLVHMPRVSKHWSGGDIQSKKRKGPAQFVPPAAVRQDQLGHWPVWVEKRIRCKLPKCTGKSKTICEKCGVALCNNKIKNYFKSFHTS